MGHPRRGSRGAPGKQADASTHQCYSRPLRHRLGTDRRLCPQLAPGGSPSPCCLLEEPVAPGGSPIPLQPAWGVPGSGGDTHPPAACLGNPQLREGPPSPAVCSGSPLFMPHLSWARTQHLNHSQLQSSSRCRGAVDSESNTGPPGPLLPSSPSCSAPDTPGGGISPFPAPCSLPGTPNPLPSTAPTFSARQQPHV